MVFTRLGPIASGERVSGSSNYAHALQIQTEVETSDCEACGGLRKELATVKEALRENRSLDEKILHSKNDELTCSLVEPYIEVKNGRYEIPVPFKSEVFKSLPNNYDCALKRTLSMRRTACKNPHLKQTLTDTFAKLIEKGLDCACRKCGGQAVKAVVVSAVFVTHTAKPRVVYDGAATTSEGASLNQAVWAGENLLHNLVDVCNAISHGKICMRR